MKRLFIVKQSKPVELYIVFFQLLFPAGNQVQLQTTSITSNNKNATNVWYLINRTFCQTLASYKTWE